MCIETIGKIFLIVANICFFLLGAILLALGLISIIDENLLYSLVNMLTTNLAGVFTELNVITQLDLLGMITANAIILCVIGGFLFILGSLGMCGACGKNATCLKIYAIIVLVLLLAEVALGVYAYMNADKFEGQIQTALKLALSKSYEFGYRFDGNGDLASSNVATELGFDLLQIYLGCCGVSNSSDWLDSATSWNRTYPGVTSAAMVPPSCCTIVNVTLSGTADFTLITSSTFTDVNTCIQTGTGTDVNSPTCYNELRNIILENKNIIVIVFVIIIAVQILGITCACYLKSQSEGK